MFHKTNNFFTMTTVLYHFLFSLQYTAGSLFSISTHTHTQLFSSRSKITFLRVHACNNSIQEAEAGGSQVQGQPGLHRKTLSPEKKNASVSKASL
jgi:hypothetical protein